MSSYCFDRRNNGKLNKSALKKQKWRKDEGDGDRIKRRRERKNKVEERTKNKLYQFNLQTDFESTISNFIFSTTTVLNLSVI